MNSFINSRSVFYHTSIDQLNHTVKKCIRPRTYKRDGRPTDIQTIDFTHTAKLLQTMRISLNFLNSTILSISLYDLLIRPTHLLTREVVLRCSLGCHFVSHRDVNADHCKETDRRNCRTRESTTKQNKPINEQFLLFLL